MASRRCHLQNGLFCSGCGPESLWKSRVGVKPSSRWMTVYARMDLPATAAQKRTLKSLRAETLTASQLAGEPLIAKLTKAPDNGAEIGGLKVAARSGWFAVRPSGTEDFVQDLR